MGEEVIELADYHRFRIDINETVAFYVLFTAPNDETAVEEAEKLWDERAIDFQYDVADVWKAFVEVTTEDEKDSRREEYEPFPVEKEYAIDRFADVEEKKTYYARYIVERSITSGINIDSDVSPDVLDLDDLFEDVLEKYEQEFYHNPFEASISCINPVVEIFRSRDLAQENFVDEINLWNIC
ncbi:MAG: hypothetical protein IJO06_13445 [Thermoguttaceae bacterium]|nr:hypothetical protein [Thermoguttaceae bacterium]